MKITDVTGVPGLSKKRGTWHDRGRMLEVLCCGVCGVCTCGVNVVGVKVVVKVVGVVVCWCTGVRLLSKKWHWHDHGRMWRCTYASILFLSSQDHGRLPDKHISKHSSVCWR